MKKSLILLLLPLVFAGCSLPVAELPRNSLPTDTANQATAEPKWEHLKQGLDGKKMTTTYEEHVYTALVFKLDNKLTQWNLSHSTEPKRLSQWAVELQSDVTINGAFFTEDFLPTGIFKADNQTLGKNAYSGESIGTISIENGRLSLVTGDKKPTGQEVFQSFPLLIRPDKTEAIEQDSEKIARRTIIGGDNNDFTYIVIFDTTPLSLYTASIVLPRLLPELTWALNLDGGPSTGIYIADANNPLSVLPAAGLPIVLSAKMAAPASPRGQ